MKLITALIGAYLLSINLPVSAETWKCTNSDGQITFTDDVTRCSGEAKKINGAFGDEKRHNKASGAKLAGFELGASLPEIEANYSTRLISDKKISLSIHHPKISKYKVVKNEQSSFNWLELYFYNNNLCRVKAVYHSLSFEAAGGSENIALTLSDKYGTPDKQGHDIKLNPNYGQYVPWIHEAYEWKLSDRNTLQLISSNQTKRASILLFDAEVELNIEKELRNILANNASDLL